MIIADIYVPSMNTTYDFQLDEQVSIRILIGQIAEILQKKAGAPTDSPCEGFLLCSRERERILPMDRTLAECGIKNGSRLFLL